MVGNALTLRLLALASLVLAPAAPVAATLQTQPAMGPQSHDSIPDGAYPYPGNWHRGLEHEFDTMVRRTGALGWHVTNDGTVVVLVPSSGSSNFSEHDAAALGISVVTQSYDIEPSDVEQILAMVRARDWQPVDPGAHEPWAFFNTWSGKVRVYSDAPVAEFQHVLERFPGSVDYVGRPMVDYSRT